ncbi:Phage tail sheath protein [compost metagenome]
MARNIGVNFNGKHIVHPGAYSKINTDSMGLSGSNTTRTIVFVGSSQGGQPGVVNWFSNPTDMKRYLRGGDLAVAGELAYSPSGEGAGASTVGFLRVEDAKKGSLTKQGLVAKAKDWGDHTNKIQIKLEDGTLAGSKKLTTYFWVDNIMETYDNIGPIFNVQYTGTAAYAGLTVEVDTNGAGKTLIVKTGADEATATETLHYDLTSGQYASIASIVTDINEHVGFSANIVAAGNKNIETTGLDAVAKQDIKTAPYAVKAFKADLLYQTRYGQLVDLSFTTGGTFPDDFSFTYLTGGENGVAPSSWADKFNLLYGEGIDMLVPLTPTESIHSEAARFIEFQSTEERNEMIGLYGGGPGEKVDDAIGRAVNLNSSRAVVAYPGITRTLSDGTTLTFPSYFTAAIIAGKIAGVAVGEPVTLDYVNLIGLEKVCNADEIKRLIEGGVTAIEYVRQRNRKGFRIAQGITTYQVDENPVYREISVRLMADDLVQELRERLESKFAGGKGLATTPALIKNEVQSFLDDKVRDEWIVDYRRTVDVKMTGNRVEVNFEAQPVEAINFILIGCNFYRESISA